MPMDAVGQAKVIGFLETAAANQILNRHLEHGGGYDSVAADVGEMEWSQVEAEGSQNEISAKISTILALNPKISANS